MFVYYSNSHIFIYFILFLLTWSLCNSEILHKEQTGRQIVQARRLFFYDNYRDMEIFHFTLPPLVTRANWVFKANGSHCDGDLIAVHLQPGSYPVVNPVGTKFPENMVWPAARSYNLTLKPDRKPTNLTLDWPEPGDWFAIGFLPEFRTRITQKGLEVTCQSWMTAYVSFTFLSRLPEVKAGDPPLSVSQSPFYLRYFAPLGITGPQLYLAGCHNISLGHRPFTLPASLASVNCSAPISLTAAEDSWNFLALHTAPLPSVTLTLHLSECASCWSHTKLQRTTLRDMFEVEFTLPSEPGTLELDLNVSTSVASLLSFQLLPVLDIGGTLITKLNYLDPEDENMTVLGCLHREVVPTPDCGHGHRLRVNASSWSQEVMVPFPQPGTYYLLLEARCHPGRDCNASHAVVIPEVSSTPCISSKCNAPFGHCERYASGGFFYTTCVCQAGWRGWGCTDSTGALSSALVTVAMLTLVLSNLAFLPAVAIALHRRHLAPAVVFAAAMLSSMFYHACDAEVYQWCVLRPSALQFADFYCAILSMWTLGVVLSRPAPRLEAPLCLVGAVIVALGVASNRVGLAAFMVPCSLALGLALGGWALRSLRNRRCSPPSPRTALAHLLPGAALTALGLGLYAGLQTRSNYWYLHSIWHILMAAAGTFLLPGSSHVAKTGSDTAEFLRDTDL